MAKPENVLRGRPILCSREVMPVPYRFERPHGSDDWLLFVTVRGGGRIWHAHGEIALRRGDLFLYRPGQAQDYGTDDAATPWDFFWAHFLPRPHWTQWLKWPSVTGHAFMHIDDAEAFDGIVRVSSDVVSWSSPPRHANLDFALNGLERILLIADECNPDHDHSIDPRLRRCVERMSSDVAHAWNISEMASIAGISPVRFAHLFREQLGESPWRFLERQRFERARRLLTDTDLPIAWVAAQVGYPDPAHFCRRFRDFSGHAPRRFRERQQARRG
jgi:AraC family transcriptional regulator, arabinose operon regulatory protein